jgi:hypothetical protein
MYIDTIHQQFFGGGCLSIKKLDNLSFKNTSVTWLILKHNVMIPNCCDVSQFRQKNGVMIFNCNYIFAFKNIFVCDPMWLGGSEKGK